MLVIASIWVLSGQLLHAQNAPVPPSVPTEAATQHRSETLVAKEGTFQLIRTSKVEEALNHEVLGTIEAHRDARKTVYFKLSPNLTVMILSKAAITDADFVPLQTLYLED